MSTLSRIAYFQDRRDEVPNQELAADLAARRDRSGIGEIAENLWNKDAGIANDCVKVLYEIGYLAPELIAGYGGDFLKLLKSRNNRLMWGAMTALSTIAPVAADELYRQRAAILAATREGSVITVDNGVKTLALVAAANPQYRDEIFPFLLTHLESCRPKDVPQHAEKIVVAVDGTNRDAFVQTLERRMASMSASQTARLRKVLRIAAQRPAS